MGNVVWDGQLPRLELRSCYAERGGGGLAQLDGGWKENILNLTRPGSEGSEFSV